MAVFKFSAKDVSIQQTDNVNVVTVTGVSEERIVSQVSNEVLSEEVKRRQAQLAQRSLYHDRSIFFGEVNA